VKHDVYIYARAVDFSPALLEEIFFCTGPFTCSLLACSLYLLIILWPWFDASAEKKRFCEPWLATFFLAFYIFPLKHTHHTIQSYQRSFNRFIDTYYIIHHALGGYTSIIQELN
jgi:hypothetical protein